MTEAPTRTQTVINRAAAKRYALGISATRRAGKFTRVGVEFLERCEARLEAEIRALSGTEEIPTTNLVLVTKLARSKAEEKLQSLAQRIIYYEVMKHPSLGCTLK